jgi:dUTP pyrophosphatase
MHIKVKRLSSDATIPVYSSSGAACFDLYSTDDVTISKGEWYSVSTAISVEIPSGFVGMVYSRSGHGFKHGLHLINGTGIIDSDYRGEIKVGLVNNGHADYTVHKGERVAQMMVIPVPHVEFVEANLSETERGENGFGSTGK